MAYLISVVRSYQYDAEDAGSYNSSTLPELFDLIMQKLLETVYYEYKKQADATYGRTPKSLGFLIDFLASQLQLMENDNHRKADGPSSKSKRPPKPQTHAVAAVTTGNNQGGENHPGSPLPLPTPTDVTTEPELPPAKVFTKALECILCCSKGHMTEECQVFLTMPIKARRSYIGARGACYNCMRTRHLSNQCDKPPGCDQCQTKHHRLLHACSSRNQNQNQGRRPAGQSDGPAQTQGAVAAVGYELEDAVASLAGSFGSIGGSPRPFVSLRTIPILVCSSEGKELTAT